MSRFQALALMCARCSVACNFGDHSVMMMRKLLHNNHVHGENLLPVMLQFFLHLYNYSVRWPLHPESECCCLKHTCIRPLSELILNQKNLDLNIILKQISFRPESELKQGREVLNDFLNWICFRANSELWEF